MTKKRYSAREMADIINSNIHMVVDKSYSRVLMLADNDQILPFIEVTFDNGQVALLKVIVRA